MKYIQEFKIFENEEEFFHCYIPYQDRKLFIWALSKLGVSNLIKNDIIDHFDKTGYFDPQIYDLIGFFLRFDHGKWDYRQVEQKESNNISYISKKMEDPNFPFNQKRLSNYTSTYIGEIKLEDWELDSIPYNL